MKLQDNLVLFSFLTDQLGGDYDGFMSGLEDSDEGRRPDAQSHFFSSFEQRESKLKVPLDHVARYDLNVLDHEEAIQELRPDFGLRYYQHIAALFMELYLNRLSSDPGRLLVDLEEYRKQHFSSLPNYEADDLRKAAFWMATGSGKTLVMHLNIRQFQHYSPFEPENILLLTPSPLLAEQHLEELRSSGVDAEHALDASPAYRGVRVLEITKLYTEGTGMSSPKGGVSIPTSHFAGPNLVLVDEGHKGTASVSELETERRWRDIRRALTGQGGLTLEYSATFAQVADGDDDLMDEYSRAILFEYAYKRFHDAGFGKDYWVINVKEAQDYGDTLLLGGLLTLYEQRRYFDDQGTMLDPYLIEPPLMAFVGAHVTAGSEVVDVIRFLDRVQRDNVWMLETGGRLLNGESGLAGPDNADAFGRSFPYLKQLALDMGKLVEDLRRRLFGGIAPLTLHRIQSADGEIGIRTKDAGRDAYCGVINVGDATSLLRKIEDENVAELGEEDHFASSLFDAIDRPGSSVSFLVGSKKFIEGWSSWRVSVMGLLKVGKKAGAQVLQLFGRGVRLKGKNFSLRRASFLMGDDPEHVGLLETLRIFGLSANYLGAFLETLRREGAEDPIDRVLPVRVDNKAIEETGLKGFELQADYDFSKEVVVFDPDGLRVVLDLGASVLVGTDTETGKGKTTYSPQAIPASSLLLLSNEDLYQRALELKRKKNWDNMYVSRQAVQELVQKYVFLAVPPEVLVPKNIDDLEVLRRATESAVESGLHTFYYREQRVAESSKVHAATVASDHPNFPMVPVAGKNAVTEQAAYALRVATEALTEVDSLLEDETQRNAEDAGKLLPRLHLDFHLYNPVLLKGDVISVPTGLVESERRFVVDLRTYWADHHEDKEWDGLDVYLLRNLPRRGLGFFQTAGFYPDFLLWLKREGEQVLAFIEPKGLVRWPGEKVGLLAHLAELTTTVGFPVLGFIVTPTGVEDVQIGMPTLKPGETKEEWLRLQGVLFQDADDYIPKILNRMKRLLESPLPAKGS